MAALTAARDTPKFQGGAYPDILAFPVATNVNIHQGSIVSLASGYARPGRTSTTDIVVGIAVKPVDNTGGADGAKTVEVFQAVARFGNSSAGDLIAQADVGAACYVVDDQTVAKTNGTNTRVAAGIILAVDTDGVWVRVKGP